MSTNPYVAFQSQAAAFLFIDGGKDLQNALTVFQILLGVSRASYSRTYSYGIDESRSVDDLDFDRDPSLQARKDLAVPPLEWIHYSALRLLVAAILILLHHSSVPLVRSADSSADFCPRSRAALPPINAEVRLHRQYGQKGYSIMAIHQIPASSVIPLVCRAGSVLIFRLETQFGWVE